MKYLLLKMGQFATIQQILPLTHFIPKEIELLLKNFWKWVILKTVTEIQLKMMSKS